MKNVVMSKNALGECNIANTCMYACIPYDAPRMRIPFIDIFHCCNKVVVCTCNNQF